METQAPKGVFLSYASQDAEAARRLAEVLRPAGIEVWFDQEGGLEHGDEWDARIRQQIKECLFFIPIVSANTQARLEGYFRIEWELAAERAMGIAHGVPFILPVVIDDTREPEALVPERFHKVQWMRLPGGNVTPETQARFLKLWSHRTGALHHAAVKVGAGTDVKEDSDSGKLASAASAQKGKRPTLLWAAAGGVCLVLLAVGGWYLWSQPVPPAPAPVAPRPAVPPAPPLHALPLTANPGYETDPGFSPVGRHVVFAWNGPKQDNYDIYIKPIGPGDLIRLTSDAADDRAPTWSPNDHWIAFLRIPPGAKRAAVMMKPAFGGPERELREIGVSLDGLRLNSPLTWTKDSKGLIACHAGGLGEAPGLFVFSTENGEKKRLTTGSAYGPAFSPEGRRLAFVRIIDVSNHDLYLLDLSSDMVPQGEPRRLTELKEEIASPVWTNDGREILFSSGGVSGLRSLWRIDASLGGNRRKEPIGEECGKLAVSEIGRRLVYSQLSRDVDIWRLEVRNRSEAVGTPTRLISSTRSDSSPHYSPDGHQIAFHSSRSGFLEIYVAKADGTEARPLTNARGSMVADPRWSPKGKMLAIHTSRPEGRSIDVVDANTGAIRKLVKDGGVWPTWSRDGRWVYYGNRGQIWKTQLAGGEEIQVTKKGGRGSAFESADGSTLYYVNFVRGYEVWKMPVGGGPETPVPETAISESQNFALVDDGLYLISPSRGLRFYDFATGRVTLLTPTPTASRGLTVSPEGRWILYSQTERAAASLMLVENFR